MIHFDSFTSVIKMNRKTGMSVCSVGSTDVSVLPFNDQFCKGETDSCTFRGSMLTAKKAVEQMRKFFLRESAPSILYDKF